MCHLDPKDAQDMVRSEIVFFDLLVRLCPADEAMSVEAGFNAMKMPVFDLEKILGPDMELRLMMNRVRENLADLRKSVENPDHSVIRKKGFFGESHLDNAPDDFRTLSVLPTLNDLLCIEEPFLRANIISGRYLDADHYLDVQFRLIKEDFVRPLREGVAEMMRRMQNSLHDFGVWRKIQEVRIYEKGVITRKIYERVGVSLELKFSLRNLGQVRWEISKRLIFGSLLCLTNDNFKSVLFASVVEREVEDLRRGIIRIRPESSKFDLNAWTKGPEFLVVESAAFFEAYRHVLSSLQKIPLDQFPLKKYIVDVERNTSLPKYILDHEGDEANVFPLKFKGRQFFGNPFSTDDWPKPEELGLDEAQFCAFKEGLCHEFALIQGPPGTGKTFIGLKLVKTILSRRRKHKIFNNGPILVVCFTNHALDQFLEGISRFTRRILRIGGRSKSVLLEEFTVQNAPLLRSKGNACQVRSDMKNHLIILERSLGELETLKKGISAGAGILSLEKLREYNIEIPSCFPSSFSLANWLSFPSNSNNLSQNFLKQILDEEKKLIFAEKKNLRFPTEDAEDDADDGGIDRVAVVDLDIEDEAAAEAQRREVESIYDTDCEAKMPTAARAKEIILHHCEISYMSIENDLNRAEKDVQDTAEQLDASNGAAECLDVLQQGGFWEEHMRKTQHLMQAELRLENWKLMRSKFQADSAFLKVPANLDLVKPPKQLVGPEENWVNARLRARWLIYRYWANRFVRIIHGKIDARMEEYRLQVERYKEAQDGALLQYTQSLDVVGMTTTGAARNISLVQNMKSRILVVEEAAEVLESHIVCCLSSHCEHLIQIGDQQQLRPSTNVYKLAKNYGLDVSLFERMVKNRVPYARLRQQHRMRPEISNLIKLNVYEDLQDHESVTQYADVLGVAKNVFFVTHNFPEESNEDLKSKSNKVEAEFLLALCRYLLLQGYKREQITILTGYSGQLFVFKKLIANFPTCKDVRITLVDNYQGEENDIILLSLVRSNTEGNIGFLKTDNRVNVALSRAKQGLFIIGNMDVLSAGSKLWSNIKLVLVNCLEKCFARLHCGHACGNRCHVRSDPGHELAKCSKPCGKSCPRNHPCKEAKSCPPMRKWNIATILVEQFCHVDTHALENVLAVFKAGYMCLAKRHANANLSVDMFVRLLAVSTARPVKKSVVIPVLIRLVRSCAESLALRV
ncbi:unnamed protein product [Notodromas monacha]|uniref:NFX1-type zinc finger-containing protein 1 n=1 Tax=Notodromas monacha TaxID=399045 RepID=A0A7R9BL71_9CRUS|nr:unnamed protein product [Notodromas monacha]CAG0916690.1 unnamed protein product [Notodromas monacha]